MYNNVNKSVFRIKFSDGKCNLYNKAYIYPKVTDKQVSNRRIHCDSCDKYSLPKYVKLNGNIYCHGCNNLLVIRTT